MAWKSEKVRINILKDQNKELKEFIQQVAMWDKDYSSTWLRIRAKNILKL